MQLQWSSTAAIRRVISRGRGGPGLALFVITHFSCVTRGLTMPSRIAFRIPEDSRRLEGVQALFVPAIFHPSILGTVCKAEILRVKQ
jgi:hypothetical protein